MRAGLGVGRGYEGAGKLAPEKGKVKGDQDGRDIWVELTKYVLTVLQDPALG